MLIGRGSTSQKVANTTEAGRGQSNLIIFHLLADSVFSKNLQPFEH